MCIVVYDEDFFSFLLYYEFYAVFGVCWLLVCPTFGGVAYLRYWGWLIWGGVGGVDVQLYLMCAYVVSLILMRLVYHCDCYHVCFIVPCIGW